MTQEPHKSNIVLIVIAIIGVIGTVIGATITVIGNYNIEKLRQETELTRIALVTIATQGGATQVSMASTISAPTDTPYPTYAPLPTLSPSSTPAPTIPPTSSTNHYFQAGLADYQSQRYDDAITNLNSCVQFNPSFSDCYNILGMAYRQKNDYGQAILNHDKAIALDPRYDYYFERGVTYHQKSVFTKPAEYDKAISDFKLCLELNPTFSNCLTRLGMVYRDSGDLAQALIYHNKAIELSPERADFYWERGITYQKMGDTEKANADFQKARDLGYGN